VWPEVGGILVRQNWSALAPLIEAAGFDVEQGTERLRRFCELILQWNRKVSNLISRNDENRVVERHVAESIAPAAWMKSFAIKRYMDFGSGGGMPAIPLALLGVGESWTLVESRRTKTLFLRRAVQELGLARVSVELGRLEDLVIGGSLLGAFDGFTSRATLALGPTLRLAAAVVAPGGSAFLWKGTRREEEIASDDAWNEHWRLAGEHRIGDGLTTVMRFVRR